jgi:hypothetical protein
MKASRIFVALFVVFTIVCEAAPARAEIKPNFVKDFLQRYRPSAGDVLQFSRRCYVVTATCGPGPQWSTAVDNG